MTASPTVTTLAATSGANVNQLVTVTNPKISKTTIDPNQSGNFRLTADYVVNGKVNGGDYFTIQMPTYANLNGELDFSASNNQFPIDLYSPAGYVIANGVYDTNTKTLTYTFTDWVNDKENISGTFNLAQFADRKTAQKSGTYPLNYNLAGEPFSTSITYTYDKHDYGVYPSSVDTMITRVDGTEKNNTFTEVIYVNPKNVDLSAARLIMGKDTPKSNALIDYNTTNFHIYQVPDPSVLTDSYYFNPAGYQDLAPEFYQNGWIYTNLDGNLEIDFGAIHTPFVVVMDAHFDPNHSNDLSTRATLIATDQKNYTSNYNFDNGFLVETSSGTGDGTVKTYRLGDYVWNDANQNGIQDAGEDPLEDVVVTLRNSNGDVVKTGVTDKYGNYLFTGLPNGTYTIEFVPPEGYLPTAVGSGTDRTIDSNGEIVDVTINGADNFTIDSGFYQPTPEPTPVPATYELGDYVWNDSNKDGIQNSNEVGIAGVKVTLTKPDGSTVTTTTNASGKYVFTGLENGTYTVTFTTPAGFEPTKINIGDSRLDSNGLSTTATINNNDNYSVDSGFYQPTVEPTPVPATYELGDYVWNDSNKDGIQNSNEVGISGVTVTLTKPDGSTVTTTTDATGKYVFKGLQNGTYTVTFKTPAGFEPTATHVGDYRLDSDGLSTTAIIQNADNFTIDSGFYQPTSTPAPVPATYEIGDYVWNDSNKDGIQNSNEVGISGVTVTLTKPDGSTATTTTDASGRYVFTGLQNGDYTVTFTTPAGFEPTATHVGDTHLDSDGLSTTVKINNADNFTIDSGFYRPTVEPTPVPATYKLGDYVWNDSNNDGIQNSNEVGIAGVVVTLTKPDGTTETTTTDASGKYVFTDLQNGEYTVTFTTPTGYVPTRINVGDDRLDSDGLSTTVVINNADNLSIDSGFHQPVTNPTPSASKHNLGDYVWNDSNRDGIQNSNEHGIAGVTVTLTKPDGTTETTTTDASGKYLFTGLDNGEYTVTFTTPHGLEPTLTNVGDDRLDSNGLSTTATIDNADNLSIDSGFYQTVEEPTPVPATYKLGDYVWNDSNNDGIQNSNEVGIAGVIVTLTKPDGSTVTTTTDASGKYVFNGLENGEYTVTFTTPQGYVPTAINVGDERLDSNGVSTTAIIDNADNVTIDSGFHKPVTPPTPVPATYTLGDYVWNDTNKDGIQNSNEHGIAGVTVTLTKPDGSTVTTTTDASGKYVFSGLENGDYTITFTTPAGYEPTKINVGDDRLDSNGLSTTATINNADNMSVDSGFYQPASQPTPVPATYELGDYVWNDTNKDGIQNSNEHGIAGVTVTLTKPDGSTETTTTDASGKYVFKGLENGDYTITFTTPDGYVPTQINVGDNRLDSNGVSTTATIHDNDNYTVDSGFYQPTTEPTPVPATYELGDYVWNDTNKDGIQNSNEHGIAGVTVTLTTPDGSTETTTTDASGKYVFKGLENGEYTVTFTTPQGYEPTQSHVGNHYLDSNGVSTKATINDGDNFTIDSGFYQPTIEPTPVPATYELGDYVWDDSNKDGIQNSNERGIAGVTVTLTKPDGTTETTTTDASGKYVFKGLENGEYTVTFTTPNGYKPTQS
ncbi:SdrD B-like domain-containing protein, partial [Staphylococcus hyicus]|uniref:SdrD B-like domain-containing protein n=1 Tax=Staphylococcus hyicus TaxID=1284 RepID=UPI001FD74692